MKEGWEYKKLGEVCDKTVNIKWDEHPNQQFKYIDLSAVDRVTHKVLSTSIINSTDAPSRAKQLVREGDVLFATTRPTLKRLVIIDKSLDGQICSTGFCVLRPDLSAIKSSWLYYALSSQSFYNYIEPLQKGASYPAVTDNQVKSYKIPVPPLSEQQRIVSYLDSAFAKIDAVAKNAEASLNEAKALFQSALTKMMEPKEGWEEKTLSMLGESKVGPFGSLLHKKDYIEGGIPIINPMHIVKGKISPNHKFTVSIEKLNKDLSSYLMHTNDIVIGRRGEMGRCAIVKPSQNGFVCGTGSIFFRPKTSIVNPRFLLTALLSSKSKKEMEALAGGATMLNLSSKSLSNLSIDIPSLQEQCAIVSTLDSLKSKVDQLQSNLSLTLTECTALKQAILRQTFE